MDPSLSLLQRAVILSCEQCRDIRYHNSTVQYITVQYSTVQYSTLQHQVPQQQLPLQHPAEDSAAAGVLPERPLLHPLLPPEGVCLQTEVLCSVLGRVP